VNLSFGGSRAVSATCNSSSDVVEHHVAASSSSALARQPRPRKGSLCMQHESESRSSLRISGDAVALIHCLDTRKHESEHFRMRSHFKQMRTFVTVAMALSIPTAL
jgi:hypothetical protein